MKRRFHCLPLDLLHEISLTLVLVPVVVGLIGSNVPAWAQGSTCATARPFCTNEIYSFPAQTNTTAEAGPNYDCLFLQPNPAWYYMKIAVGGDLAIDISQVSTSTGDPVDVDFICWGPFDDPTIPCSNPAAYLNPFNEIDCSYSSSATEVCDIPTAVAGEYYLLLLTNYANVRAIITFSKGGGTAETDCGVVSRKTYAAILLDRTDSMNALRSTGNARCWDARHQAKNDVTTFFQDPMATAVTIWTFDNPPVRVTGLVDEPTALAALDALPPLSCISNTPLAWAMCEASDYLASAVPGPASLRQIIVNSDGGENASDGHLCGGLEGYGSSCSNFTPGSWQDNVCSHLRDLSVVHVRYWDSFSMKPQIIGNDAPIAPQDVLHEDFFRAIAAATGGTYIEIKDSDESYPRPINPRPTCPTASELAGASPIRVRQIDNIVSGPIDTIRYGGAVWAADSLRWEALRNGVWTFDTGVASSFEGPNKPKGYHVLMEGWHGIDESGVGDYSNIVDMSLDLGPPASLCACGLQDSVLVFYDQSGTHPQGQSNIVVSPWIDLKAGGDSGRPGKVILYDVYAEMPLENYVFLQFQTRWYPSACANGAIGMSPFRRSDSVGYFGGLPFCTGPGASCAEDLSSIIDTYAEQVQIGIGVVELSRTHAFGSCVPTGNTNTTPWLDNISLGVYGPSGCPIISISSFDALQDAFATDGTLNPASSGRFDISFIRDGDRPGPGTAPGDTLVACGDGGNTEVRLVFHVRPGPYTNAAALSARASLWSAEPSLGAGWYSARMDTAEYRGLPFRGRWMSAFHESDPGFSGTDRTPDPQSPSELRNEILPDYLFTPGSRIDYFAKARYLPPDPRNPGGTQWCVFPDTTGRRYHEVEILPSSMAGDSSWNCTLYVDHHDDRDLADQALEEQGLTASLGFGSNNAEGTRFDRFDIRSPSSAQASFGRPIETTYGCSIIQAFAYKNVVWHSGGLSSLQFTAEDANILGPWLTMKGIGNNRFWGTGDGLARSVQVSCSPSALAFMRVTSGVLFNCDTIRNANCPSPSALDQSYCLQLSAAAGSHFSPSVATSLRGNGCREVFSFDLLSINGAIVGAKGQMNYVKNSGNMAYASVTNFNTIDVNYKIAWDGFGVARARTTPANPNDPSQCTIIAASLARTDNVMDWFATPFSCKKPAGLVDVIGSESPTPPQFRAALGNAYPNPMNPTTRIPFTNGTPEGRVTITVYDLTGRVVKKLIDARLPAGSHEVVWDGRNEASVSAASGMYFYKMTSENGRFVASKKLLLMK